LDPETAVIHFWSPGGVRRRPQHDIAAAGGRCRVCRRCRAIAAAATDTLVYSQFADLTLLLTNCHNYY